MGYVCTMGEKRFQTTSGRFALQRGHKTQQLKGEVGQQEDYLEIKNILVDQRTQ